MSVTSGTWYGASCDGDCGEPLRGYEDEDVLFRTEADLLDYAFQCRWAQHQGQLLCEECKALPACDPHDFFTNAYAAPFCSLCKELPNGHLNVPLIGQTEIAIPVPAGQEGGES